MQPNKADGWWFLPPAFLRCKGVKKEIVYSYRFNECIVKNLIN